MKNRVSYSSPMEINNFGFHEYGFKDQWEFSVVCVDDNFWEIYEDRNYYNPFDDDREEYIVRRERMLNLIHNSAKLLTERQQQILALYLNGNTQKEIADELGITQGAVQMAMYGKIDFRTKKKYGGIISALIKRINKNERNY